MARNVTYSSMFLGFLLGSVFLPLNLQAQDLTPPSVPSSLVADASCGQVGLSWSAATDEAGGSGLYAYVIQRWEGGKLGDETTIRAKRTNFSDTNHVTPSTTL